MFKNTFCHISEGSERFPYFARVYVFNNGEREREKRRKTWRNHFIPGELWKHLPACVGFCGVKNKSEYFHCQYCGEYLGIKFYWVDCAYTSLCKDFWGEAQEEKGEKNCLFDIIFAKSTLLELELCLVWKERQFLKTSRWK